MCDEAEGGSVALDISLLLFCFKGNLGQNHLAAKMEWKRHLITGKGEMGELWGKKAVGDLVPEVYFNKESHKIHHR